MVCSVVHLCGFLIDSLDDLSVESRVLRSPAIIRLLFNFVVLWVRCFGVEYFLNVLNPLSLYNDILCLFLSFLKSIFSEPICSCPCPLLGG